MNKFAHLLISVLLVSCGGSTKNTPNAGEVKEAAPSTAQIPELKMPDIPMAIVEPAERAAYVVGCYWDNLSLDSIKSEQDSARIEQYFSNYLAIINEANRTTLAGNIEKSLQKISADSAYLSLFNHMADKYLYNPNSPFRNDETYLVFVDLFLKNPKLSFVEKERLNFTYTLLQKNRIGQKAEDFAFYNGEREERLSAVKADVLVLYFNNPGCPACEEVQKELET
ncbi:MAG: DUF5106 domain-containing protein, partial [Bacteroidales bacterium]